jgi:beta-phosphoglucomutase-like phosphatase (HAD superfamily)
MIDEVIDANDVLQSKPEPDVYLEAAKRLGVSPHECIAVDDSAAGIYSAARAGMCPIAVGSSACIHSAQTCFSDLENVGVQTLQQIHSAWSRRMHPVDSSADFWD